jgi:hypothetical protein
VNSKKAVIAAVLIGTLAWVLIGGEDDPPPATPQVAAPEPSQTRSVPMRPTQPPQAQGSGFRYPQPNPTDAGPRSAQGPNQAPDQFRFRPLTERERERSSTYRDPGYQTLDDTGSPSWSSGDPWAQDGYRFRPIAPSPGGGTRWQAPYPRTPGGAEPGASGQWADQLDPPPWRSRGGSPHPATSPPAQRMLPSLDWSDSRTLGAR